MCLILTKPLNKSSLFVRSYIGALSSLEYFLCSLVLFSCSDLKNSQQWLFLCVCVCVCEPNAIFEVFHLVLVWQLTKYHKCLSQTDFSLQFTANITEGEGRGKMVHTMYEETCREDAGISAQTECLCLSGRMPPWLRARSRANNRADSLCPNAATWQYIWELNYRQRWTLYFSFFFVISRSCHCLTIQ